VWDTVREKYESLWKAREEVFVVSGPVPVGRVSFSNINPQSLAFQLTLQEQTVFHRIGLPEFYGKAWENPAATPNLTAFIERFDKMKKSIASTIVKATKTGGAREGAATMSIWINAMGELVGINNFNSAMQIYHALCAPAVEELGLMGSLPKVDQELVLNMGSFMDERDNYEKYREASDHIEGGTTPCIPYYHVLLQDLAYLEADATLLEDGTSIDFIKMTCMATIFERVQEFLSQLYNYPKDHAILNMLFHLPPGV